MNLCVLCGALLLFLLSASVVQSQGAVSALAYSPDGKRLAVGTYGQVALYETATWQPIATFMQIEDSARSLAFRPDGQALAIGHGLPGRSGRITFWDRDGKETYRLVARQSDTVETIAFRPDGKGLLIGANDKQACYFLALPAETSALLDEHNGRVQAVAFSPREHFVFVTGAMDKVVKVWDETSRHVVVNFDQSEGGITGLAFLPNGEQFVGSSLDGKLRWWQVGFNKRRQTYTGSHYRTVNAHTGGVYALALSGDGKRLITGGADNVVAVWNAENGGQVRAFKDSLQPLYAVALSPDGKIAAAGGREGVVRIWDVENNKLLQTLTAPPLPRPIPSQSIKTTQAANKRK